MKDTDKVLLELRELVVELRDSPIELERKLRQDPRVLKVTKIILKKKTGASWRDTHH